MRVTFDTIDGQYRLKQKSEIQNKQKEYSLAWLTMRRIVGLPVKKEPNRNISLYTPSYVMCGHMSCLVNTSGVRFQKEYLENFVREF